MVVSALQPAEATSLSTSFSNTSLLDQTVEEVLGMMMGVPVSVSDTTVAPSNAPVTITGVIGLAGALSGAFSVVINEFGARQITASMMGMDEVPTIDDTVLDGIGEITNILAGAWKLKVPSLSSACLLSVPTVVTGTQYDVHRKSSTFKLSRSYRFNDSAFTITICGEQP